MASQNQVISPGSVTAGAMEIDVYAEGSYQTIQDIKSQIITTNDGKQLYLGDIATIEKGYADPASTYMFVNGKRSIGIGVSTASDKDVVATGDKLKVYLDEMKTRLPAGLELISLYPENVIAREANNVFVINLIESILIVVFILFFVMGFKASVLIGSSLIFSIGGTLLLMEYFGAGLNRTSLAGFIIAMGMLVDNAIVVTDNAMVNMKKGMTRRDAIIKGATDPQWGLLGATLIAIFSFMPLFTAKASVAEMVSPLFIVIGISLALSWILALTQTTSFADLMFKEPKPGAEIKDPYDTKIYRWFEGVLGKAIHYRWRTIISVVALFFASLVVFGMLPQNFFPSLDKEYFRADCVFPSGYSINYVKDEMKKIEEHLLKEPSVKTVSTTLGATPPRYYLVTASYGPMSNYANILVELHTKDSTKVMEERFNRYVRENYPNIVIRSALFKVSPVPDAEIEIGYLGNNIDTLISLTSRVENIMRKSGLVDQVRSSWGNKVPTLKPTYSQDKGQRLGVSRQAMVQNISIATQGLTLGAFRERDQFLPIMLKDENSDNFMLEDIANIPVFGADGTAIPLSQVTDIIKYEFDYDEIRRFNRERIMLAQSEPKRGQNSMAAF
ncbi:MAG: efflux RND transporter permease subunit, partial [Rikenellaceae bacterium]